jgi:type VI secretion system protein VasG
VVPKALATRANLLKPALARGELRTVAATTWSEYKKYFEKDPALARRFQLVKVDEPATEVAIGMLRGLRERYEQATACVMRDDAVVAPPSWAAATSPVASIPTRVSTSSTPRPRA